MARANEIKKNFQWRDREGGVHNPKDMDTKHLFFTLRMIWNHSVGEDMRIEPYNKYYFPEFYTREYMKDAVWFVADELSKRGDLTPYFVRNLSHMKQCMEKAFAKEMITGGKNETG